MFTLSFENFLTPFDAGIFREVPLSSPGKLFTSPMPTGAYDKGRRLFKILKKHHVDHVFPLVTDRELEKKGRSHLLAEYEKRGLTYSRYIIEDYQAPSLKTIKDLVKEAEERLGNQEKILIHCHAGVGRTSLAAACVVVAVNGVTADEAIVYIRSHMTVNLTTEQAGLVREFEEFYLPEII